MSTFTRRDYRISDDGHAVVCNTMAEREDLEALRDALAWRRDRPTPDGLQDAGAVLALRALVTLDDRLIAMIDAEGQLPLTVDREQALTLCEVANSYVADRDVESYQSPDERARIARLRTLAGPLMDTCAGLAAAQEEAVEKALLS